MHDLRIIPAYPSIAINLEHTRSLRIRAEKSPTAATRYQLAVYSQDPDDVLVLPLDGCESLETAQAALRDLVAPQHGCGHAHAHEHEHEHDEWDASPEDLRATIDEVEAANEKLETKLVNVGKALDAFANAFTRALPAIAEPMRGVLQQFASWLIEARRELGLTEHDLRDGFAGLHASVPEPEPSEIDTLLDRVVSKYGEQTSEPEPSATEQPNEGDRELAQLVNGYSAGNELGENLHTAAARWLFCTEPRGHLRGSVLRVDAILKRLLEANALKVVHVQRAVRELRGVKKALHNKAWLTDANSAKSGELRARRIDTIASMRALDGDLMACVHTAQSQPICSTTSTPQLAHDWVRDRLRSLAEKFTQEFSVDMHEGRWPWPDTADRMHQVLDQLRGRTLDCNASSEMLKQASERIDTELLDKCKNRDTLNTFSAVASLRRRLENLAAELEQAEMDVSGEQAQARAQTGTTEPEPSATERLAAELECRTFRVGWETDVEHAISSWLANVDATKWPRNCKFETHEDAHSRTTRVNTFVDAVSIELLCIVEVVGVPSVMMVYAAETIANVINRLSNMTTLLDYERSRNPHPAYAAASRAAWRCRDYLVIAHKRVSGCHIARVQERKQP